MLKVYYVSLFPRKFVSVGPNLEIPIFKETCMAHFSWQFLSETFPNCILPLREHVCEMKPQKSLFFTIL